ncbi:hypothetical protein CSA37_06265 [Candidatus Fermentibacteria bacterium]|nr:MAG: hypothetical protein CSA37_06265 [Candidatus Fermentibacteria bacterium]
MKAGLIGYPVKHSLSPLIHQVFMSHFNIKGEYLLFSVAPENFMERAAFLGSDGYSGVNVTVPHKKAAAEFCDVLSDEASSACAVNTILFSSRGAVGYNTDVQGFRAIAGSFPRPLAVVGNGGAAAAIRVAEKGNVISVNSRSGSLPENLPSTGTVVNATPLGWRDDDSFPIQVPPEWAFIDLNYNSRWRWRNSLKNVKVATGEEMLVEQAACSFRIWTGHKPGIRVKAEALKRIRSGFNE